MWNKLAEGIIRYRLLFIILIGIITIFMGFKATTVTMSYDFARTVPPNDPDMVYLNQFKEQFGEDSNIIVVGMKDSAVYKLDNFLALRELTQNIKGINGVTEVVSLPVLKMILKDTANNKFAFANIFPNTIETQAELDSLLNVAIGQRI